MTMEQVLDRLAGTIERLEQADTERKVSVQTAVDAAIEKLKGGEPSTPSKREETLSRVQVYDRFDEMWGEAIPDSISESERERQMAANTELAMMIFGGTWRMTNPVKLYPPEDLIRRWVHHIESSSVRVADANGKPILVVDDV